MGQKYVSQSGVVPQLPLGNTRNGSLITPFVYDGAADVWYKIWKIDTATGTNNYSFIHIKILNRYYMAEWRVAVQNNSSSSAPILNINKMEWSHAQSGYASTHPGEFRVVKSGNVYTGFVLIKQYDIFRYMLYDTNAHTTANKLNDPTYFTWWRDPVVETPGTGTAATEVKW